jgi:uncharacterized protein (DUF885 family)
MMRMFLPALLLAALAAGPASAQPAQPVAAQSDHAAQLRALFAASDEAMLSRNPIQALFRGDMRYADQFGDYISDAYVERERQAALNDLAALARIDRSALGRDDRVSYDIFKFQRTQDLKGYEPELVRSSLLRPIDHFAGFHTFMPDMASGQGIAPFKSVADYENNLKRLDGYVAYLDAATARMREGLAAGITNPQLVMANVVAQLDTLIAEGVTGSTFYKPVMRFPEIVGAADRARLTAAYESFIRDRLMPTHVRLRDFVRDEYMPRARSSVGLSAMPGGSDLYAYLAETSTTTNMAPDAIHDLGLAEVRRIRGEMERIKEKTGFRGTLAEFFTFMRSDRRFAPASTAAVREAFLAISKKVAAVVPRQFARAPRSPLEVRPVPAYKEKTEAAGSYESGTPDGSRPGVFYYNSYDLPSRFTWGFETLFLHEGVPGHHFQISLAQENESLPAFQRFGGNTAFVEGWALYAESLGPELGLFTDPYQHYGHLNDEMLRAMRLVVDTGLHAKGWSRDQAIEYMLANSAMGRTDATAEVERYIAIPGQALAYKVGQLTIRRLRSKAETALGSRFDPRAFHEQVLMSGALPMAVLETKIDDWIAASRGS